MKKSIFILAAAAIAITAIPLTACKKKTNDKLCKYEISAEYGAESGTLTATESFTFYNSTENQIDALEFNLWGNAYREGAKYPPLAESYSESAYYSGKSYGKMEVAGVENCDGWQTGGDDGTLLLVKLKEPVYPEQRTTVEISYTLALAKVNHRTGITESTVNLGNFYPVLCAYGEQGYYENPYYSCGDPFISECANYEVSLTFPESYTAATSGSEKSAENAGGKVTASYSLERARDFAVVLSENFKTEKRKVGGVEVTAYYCKDDAPEKAIAAACESLEFFGGRFADYPYPTYSVVFTPLSVNGMEYPALVMINDGLDESDAVYTAVHETAHQWWYALVGNDQVNEAFMDEGLAEYSTLLFFEANLSYGFTRTAILGGAIKAYRAYYSVYNQIFGKADTTMKRSLADFASEYEYVNVAYNKALLMFESVRTAMGDEKFFSALSSYCRANSFKIATSEELISRFAALYDVEGIFVSYIEGKVVI